MPTSLNAVADRVVAVAFLLVGIPFSALGPVLLLMFFPDVVPGRLWAIGFFLLEVPLFFYTLASEKLYPPEEVERTRIEGLSPREEKQLLRSKRHRFSWFILRTLSKVPNASESQIARQARSSDFRYTNEGVGRVLDDLAEIGLVSVTRQTYEKQYHLTERGTVCLRLIDEKFPRSWFRYLWCIAIYGTT